MKNIESVTLHLDHVNKNRTMKFKHLYDYILKEIERYEFHDSIDDLMEQDVLITLYDLEGQMLNGYCTQFVGWLQDGGVLIVSNLDSICKNE